MTTWARHSFSTAAVTSAMLGFGVTALRVDPELGPEHDAAGAEPDGLAGWIDQAAQVAAPSDHAEYSPVAGYGSGSAAYDSGPYAPSGYGYQVAPTAPTAAPPAPTAAALPAVYLPEPSTPQLSQPMAAVTRLAAPAPVAYGTSELPAVGRDGTDGFLAGNVAALTSAPPATEYERASAIGSWVGPGLELSRSELPTPARSPEYLYSSLARVEQPDAVDISALGSLDSSTLFDALSIRPR